MARGSKSIVVRVGLVVAAAAVVLGCFIPYAYNPGDQFFGPMALVEMPVIAIPTIGLAVFLLWTGVTGRTASFGLTVWCVGMFTLITVATRANPSGAGEDPRSGRLWLLLGLAIGAVASGIQADARRVRPERVDDD